MGLVRVTEITERGNSVELRGLEYARSRTRNFVVEFDSPTDGDDGARLAAGIPRVGDSMPGDPTLAVRRVSPESLNGSPLVFSVRVEYEATARLAEDGTIYENPLDVPPDISIDFQALSVPFTRDARDGRPVQNSAEQDFDPPPETDVYDSTVVVVRNEPTFSHARARQYIGRYNSLAFLAAAPDCVRLIGISAKRQAASGRFYWQVTYTFRMAGDGDTLERKILDQGTRYAEQGGDGSYQLAVDDAGNPIGTVLLDGLGHRLPSENAPVYLTYWDGKQADFNELLE